MKTHHLLLMGAALILIQPSLKGGDGDTYWQAESFFGYERGDYGTGDTIGVATTGVRLFHGGNYGQTRLSVPVVYVYGRDVQDTEAAPFFYTGVYDTGLPGSDRTVYGSGFGAGDDPTDKDAFGLGDITLETDFDLVKGRSLTGGVMVGVKLPTADEDKGLGTGEFDWNVGFYGAYALQPEISLFGRYTFTVAGEPSNADFRNTSAFIFGSSFQIAADHSASVFLETKQSIDRRLGTAATLYASWRYKFGDYHCSLTPYVGLTDEAPDFGLALALGMTF